MGGSSWVLVGEDEVGKGCHCFRGWALIGVSNIMELMEFYMWYYLLLIVEGEDVSRLATIKGGCGVFS